MVHVFFVFLFFFEYVSLGLYDLYISLLFFFCTAVQTSPMWVSACWMMPCEHGVHFPMVHQSSDETHWHHDGVMCLRMVCPHPYLPTHCQWIARATKKRSHVFGVQIWDAKECGICLHDCVCVCKQECCRVRVAACVLQKVSGARASEARLGHSVWNLCHVRCF